jgi:hypothetical protein
MIHESANSDAQYSPSRSIACHWGPAWLASSSDDCSQSGQAQAVKADSIPLEPIDASEPMSLLNVGDRAAKPVGEQSFSSYSDSCWSQVSVPDYRDLTTKRNYPPPCRWCGGRLVHNRLCDWLCQSWQPTLPFGKHKGKRLSDVPIDYLQWLAQKLDIEPNLRETIQCHIQQRRKETSTDVI